jgi:iron-sulfur cluster insertion protein|tara:strand:+ start:314 stop:637 length:324 start_codon:yes stop_codon:yes gene_type:complete
MITLTTAAVQKIQAMAEQDELDKPGIRVVVVGGGCSGLTYAMDFESDSGEGDQIFQSGDVSVYVDPMSYSYLEGTEVDFVETFSYSGFRFNNPNAKKSCGCGSSFTV